MGASRRQGGPFGTPEMVLQVPGMAPRDTGLAPPKAWVGPSRRWGWAPRDAGGRLLTLGGLPPSGSELLHPRGAAGGVRPSLSWVSPLALLALHRRALFLARRSKASASRGILGRGFVLPPPVREDNWAGPPLPPYAPPSGLLFCRGAVLAFTV